jgi:argininosuccinate lyase
MGYNRDTQWTKYLIMDLVDECLPAPRVMSELVASLQVDEKGMAALSQARFITAPDLLERIVQEWGLPFRRAKGAVEKAVKYSEAERVESISFSALKRALQEEGLSVKMDERFVLKAQEPRLIITRRKTIGGSSPQALQKNILSVSDQLRILQRWLSRKRQLQSTAKTRLAEMERGL